MSSDTDDDPPLPKGWTSHFSNSQKRTYYVHAASKHTQWHFPTASEAANPAKAKQRAAINRDQERKRQSGESLGSIVGNVVAPAKQQQQPAAKRQRRSDESSTSTSTAPFASADTTSVAIIVPYRDIHVAQKRSAHLKKFVPHMHQFLGKLLKKSKISAYHVYIVEQSDDQRKFNRGKLLNIGFDLARKSPKKHDVFIFHDVDLLPQDDLADWYCKFPTKPIHIARVWDRYSNNPKYFGGVVSFSSSDYRRINGYPNTFWGWGGEDDEMQKRLEACRIKWEWPPSGSLVDLEQMNLSQKLQFLRENKKWKCMVKWEALEEHDKTWKVNGLADLKYKVLENAFMDATKNASKVHVDVKLNANHWANDKCGVEYMPPPGGH
uniref:WW domain-containing protein n=1 Tax=Grammatophora oceanica TaxID=210454 RepID=A0A7S1UR56_9STRA|mmetsp:Transcript_17905/g.26559  ORF Transcript_17905/g.26559 Transcript_17905/m.26559 type:complete len:379 (+) Transcript_17905:216-1352(+)|eukprot:CAMPEP_0194032554 /NCGR_PEP_ID=MMETSP0009_2-20130614/5474_1 /TAXON_ID=210454 /ORGANISM="Grammatophora oceanica, Strain CCMP 410" /LENGTH=378 /DNA_ID=CAMNT_0038673037 /DNA_START=215 /DNA_END=1351 /DNA_ORIENTATION=-